MNQPVEVKTQLAMAMGWRKKPVSHYGFAGKEITRDVWHNHLGITYSGIKIPDPFEEVRDDFAVLEWMQDYKSRNDVDQWIAFGKALEGICSPARMSEYEVGYYAMAACKVFNITLSDKDND